MADLQHSTDALYDTNTGLIARLSVASKLRFHQVQDDHLDPTVRRLDYVLLAPAERYVGEGYYLVADSYGGSSLFSCSVTGTRSCPQIRLHSHNNYGDRFMSRDAFEECVLGKVAMTCKVVDHRLIDQI